MKTLKRLCTLTAIGLLLCSTTVAFGSSPPSNTPVESATPEETDEVAWSYHAKGGVSFFSGSRSKTLQHLFKPCLRLSALATLSEYTRLGVEVLGVVSESNGYRLLGAYVAGQTNLYRGAVFELDLLYGMGAGTGPKILSPQLDTSTPIAAWAHWGLGLHWALPGDAVAVGLEFVHEQVSVVSASFVLSVAP